MKKADWSLLLAALILFSLSRPAFGDSLPLVISSPGGVEARPGGVVTACFILTNNGSAGLSLEDAVRLPAGWREVAPPEAAFTLPGGGQTARIRAFFIPGSFPAGEYSVGYAVRDSATGAPMGRALLPVAVPRVFKLDIYFENAPETVISGQPYEAAVRVVNAGNSREVIRLEAAEAGGAPLVVEPAEVVLDPGKPFLSVLRVTTPEGLRRKTVSSVAVTAKTPAGQESEKRYLSVRVVPKVTGDGDIYIRVPSTLSLGGFYQAGEYGYDIELAGGGPIDETGARRVDFVVRGPDNPQSLFGTRGTYWFGYRGPKFDFSFGDKNYSLSSLTERSRYGRGADFAVRMGGFAAGALYVDPKFDGEKEEEAGAFVQYAPGGGVRIKGNFLRKSGLARETAGGADRGEIYSVQAGAPFRGLLALDVEAAYSRGENDRALSGWAFRAEGGGELFRNVRYHFEKIRSTPDFIGYFRDLDYSLAVLEIPLYRGLRGGLYYSASANNLDLDDGKGQAPRERTCRGSLYYELPWGLDTMLEYEDYAREDGLAPAEFDMRERGFRLRLAGNARMFGAQAYIERWRREEAVLGEEFGNMQRYMLFASFTPADWQSYTGSVIIGNSRYSTSSGRTKVYSLGGRWRWRGLSLEVNWQVSRDGGPDRVDVLTSRASYRLPFGHYIEGIARWYKRLGGEETTYYVTYKIPFGIPVGKRKSVGMVEGRVRLAEDGSPVAGLIVSADDAAAVTDGGGRFVFPALKPGRYGLWAERASIGYDRVFTERMPMQVEVAGGKKTEVELGVAKAARLAGRVALFDLEKGSEFIDGARSGPGKLRRGKPPAGVRIELTDGKERFVRYTEKDGTFLFEDIRPGTWTLKADPANLPPHHYYQQGELVLEIGPGNIIELFMNVFPRARALNIIDGGRVE